MYEFGVSEQWETEIMAMLQEGRGPVFGEAAGDNALGNTIVGGALTRIKDPGARELFNAMAVVRCRWQHSSPSGARTKASHHHWERWG